MRISWLGHACFLLESASGVKIITDPYEPGSYNGAVGYDPIGLEADIVTVSHSHADHSYTQPFKTAKILNRQGQASLKGIEIDSVLSYHDPARGSLRGENLIFTITADDLRLVHCGDLGTEDIDYSKFKNTDIAFIPVGGTFTLDFKAAAKVMAKLNSKITIPMHFKTSKLGFAIDGVDKFLKGREYEQKDILEVTSRNIRSFKNIVVLTHQR